MTEHHQEPKCFTKSLGCCGHRIQIHRNDLPSELLKLFALNLISWWCIIMGMVTSEQSKVAINKFRIVGFEPWKDKS